MVRDSPWLSHYGEVPESLDYPDATVWEMLARASRPRAKARAFEFLGATASYGDLTAAVDRFAGVLSALGLEARDRITVSLPTCPQAVIAFYAAAKIGAVPAFIHPLSTTPEIQKYLAISHSRVVLTLDAFYPSFAALPADAALETLILTRIPDYLPLLKRPLFRLTKGRRIAAIPRDRRVRWWTEMMRNVAVAPATPAAADEPAAILYSGGTTGEPKGILLSHRNFVSEGMQVAAWVGMTDRDVVLSVLPIFHGFGLGALVNAPLMCGASIVMVPTFTPTVVAKLIRTKRPTLMAGVPTLYEALTADPSLRRADLSCLRAAFSGADSLPRPVKERFERLVAERGGHVRLIEGYGLTETVTGIMGMPLHEYRDGSVGVPLPDMLARICRPGSDQELPPGSEGEICVSGPAVMLGYLDAPAATAEALHTDRDGSVWLHTGDIGLMDEDGFFRFTSRLKHMIKSSGFNVYPSQVEAVLYRHPAVAEAAVIGVPDQAQGERVKAFIVLRDPYTADEALSQELIAHCRNDLIRWACPREIEFRSDLPMTRLGKVDYTLLRREAATAAAPSVAARERLRV